MVMIWTSTHNARTAALIRWAAHSRTCARMFITALNLALQRRRCRSAFQARNRVGRHEVVRSALGAAHVGMAGVASGITGDRGEPRDACGVTYVVDQCPRAIERRRAEVSGIPVHDVTRAVAHAAADAFDRGVDLLALRRLGEHARTAVLTRES